MYKLKILKKEFEQIFAKKLNRFPKLKKLVKYLRHRIYKPSYKYKVSDNYIYIDLFKNTNTQVFFGYYTNECIKDNELLFGEIDKTDINIGLDDKLSLKCINIITKEIKDIGTTGSWNWQQGAMLQWISPNNDLVIYNDFNPKKKLYVSKIYDIKSERLIEEIDTPYSAIDWNKKYILTLNYDRLRKFRPDYGYFSKKEEKNLDKENDGIWKKNLIDKESNLLISLKDLSVKVDRNLRNNTKHWVNHILFNPDKERFVFLYRWIEKKGIKSVLFMFSNKTLTLNQIYRSEIISHYDWINNEELIIFLRKRKGLSGYFILNVLNGDLKPIGQDFLIGDGHPRFLKGSNCFITDTYPDKSRLSKLLKYDLKKNKGELIGEFYQPLKFDSEYRCDLHPRVNIDAGYISFDSAHSGKRSQYLIKF